MARVRENQRKSRARRQQYIEELEQKVAVCNAQAQQREIEHLIALQKLEAENAKLRTLLQRTGVAPDMVDDFLKDVSQPTPSEKIAIPRLKACASSQTPPGCNQVSATKAAEPCTPASCSSGTTACKENLNCEPARPQMANTCRPRELDTPISLTDTIATPNQNIYARPTGQCTTTIHPSDEGPLPMSSADARTMPQGNVSCQPLTSTADCREYPTTPSIMEPPLLSSACVPTAPQQQNIKLPPIASLCDCGPESMYKWPRVASPTDTTLCELAQDLIEQYNTRGLDLDSIRERLSNGFRNGDAAGCRVQNNILFEVLDEISGDAHMPGGS